jgi:PIN domain nuclease of toxin-antitoxin system
VRALLDTNCFLWWHADDRRLSPRARRAIANSANDIYVSAVIPFEMVLKVRSGKLRLSQEPADVVRGQLSVNGFMPLPVTLDHALAVGRLPHHHDDPFDRLLIAQAVEEDLPVITSDDMFSHYPIRTYW